MAGLSRRDLVQRGAVVVGGLAAARVLAACGGSDATSPFTVATVSATVSDSLIVPQCSVSPVTCSTFDGSNFD